MLVLASFGLLGGPGCAPPDAGKQETSAGAEPEAGGGPPATVGMTVPAGEVLARVAKEIQARMPGAVVKDMLALEQQPGATPALPQVTVAAGPRATALDGAPGPSPAMGPETALVKVVVFSEFQCPVCRRIVEPMKEIVRVYPDDVQIIFKHHALVTHAQARTAATAAIAAFRQGKFWEYHDRVFQEQGALAVADLERHAETMGLDVPRFRADMNAPDVVAQVDYESAMADRVGAVGTPAFFINGELLPGWGSYPGFAQMVERALETARGLERDGVARAEAARRATMATGGQGARLAELLWGPPS